MKSVKNFNGNLNVTILQGDKAVNFKVSGFKSLTVNQLSGTIATHLFKLLKRYQSCGAKVFDRKSPVIVKMTDTEGNYVADTAKIDITYAERMTLTSERKFALSLFNGLVTLDEKIVKATISDITSNDNILEMVADNDQLIWKKAAKVEIAE